MMNDLLLTMSSDMNINRFCGETENSFIYRLCYSALGQWCLRIAQNSFNGAVGTTKHNQTIVLKEKLARFSEVFPVIVERFIDTNNRQTNFPVHIRRVYEETGYILSGDKNRNQMANYGRCIPIGNKALFFGIPTTEYTVNGLGVFTCPTEYIVSAKEFMIRDNLTYEEFFYSQFDSIDFYDKDIDMDELEFFNPQLCKAPSKSWAKQMETDCTIARKGDFGPFYRVKRNSDLLQFADEPMEQQSDNFTSYEYRRLYYALKAYYKSPLKATITQINNEYSKIRIGGHLPNREYYYLLLLAWPMNSAFDKNNFLIRNKLLPEATKALKNIGIEIKGGYTDDK